MRRRRRSSTAIGWPTRRSRIAPVRSRLRCSPTICSIPNISKAISKRRRWRSPGCPPPTLASRATAAVTACVPAWSS